MAKVFSEAQIDRVSVSDYYRAPAYIEASAYTGNTRVALL